METDVKKLSDVEIKALLWEIEQNILQLQQNKKFFLQELLERNKTPIKNEANTTGEGTSPA